MTTRRIPGEPVESIRVRNWAELLDALYAASWKEKLGRFRSDFAFRGLEAPTEELLTGLMRFGNHLAELEGHLLRNFRKYACRNAVTTDSTWNWSCSFRTSLRLRQPANNGKKHRVRKLDPVNVYTA
jgi:hypothetical protein